MWSRTILLLAVLLPASGVAPLSGAALTMTRHPWINLRTTNSVLIAWQTDAAATGTVLFAAAGGAWSAASHAGAAMDHAVSITGLTPATLYHYRIVSGADTLTDGSDTFRTAPTDPEPFRFVVFGDIGRATAEQKEIAARVDSLNADFALLAGDIIYDAGEPWNYTPQYFDIYRPTIRRIPFYAAPGNHDEYYDGGATYLAAYYLPSNNPAGTERYYSFDYLDAHFVSLEVIAEDVAPDASMLSWLASDLAASTQRWKFVFFHVPMYSNAGGHGGDPVIAAAMEPILDAGGVDVVFQGHNHFYTRTFPVASGLVVDAGQEPNYRNPGGPIYVVAGGGGKALYALVTPLSPLEALSKSTFHAVVVDVDGPVLSLRAIERDGTVFDQMTLTRDQPTAIALTSFTAEPDPDGVRLRWVVARAVGEGVVFHVYRAEDPSGAAMRLDPPGAGIAAAPRSEFVDRTAEAGRAYLYRLGVVENGRESLTGWISGARGDALRFALGRPRPNPSGGAAAIPFTLARPGAVRARIVDAAGRLVRTIEAGALGAGPNLLRWDGLDARGRPAPSGIYFAEVRAGDRVARARLALLR